MNSYKIEIPRYKTKFGLKNKISRALWNISNLLFFRYTPSFIKPFNIWRIFLLKLFGAKIGKYTIVYPSVKIMFVKMKGYLLALALANFSKKKL